jgi:hypothetical protein
VNALEDDAKNKTRTIALDWLETNLHIGQSQQSMTKATIRNAGTEHNLLHSAGPTHIYGWSAGLPVALRHRVRTRHQYAALLMKNCSSTHDVHVSPTAEWSPILCRATGGWHPSPPSELKQIEGQSVASWQVDLLTGTIRSRATGTVTLRE